VILPLPLLLGLLVAAADRELLPALPGSADASRLLPLLPLLAMPTLLAAAALQQARSALVTMRRPLVPPRALLRLSNVATALVVHVLFAFGDYGDHIERLAWDSHLGASLLVALPAFLAELPRIGIAALAAANCEVAGDAPRTAPLPLALLPDHASVAGFARLRLGGHLLVALPILTYGAALDLLQLHRPTHVATLVTSPGAMLATFAVALLLMVVVPFWFPLAFGVLPLPEPIGERLRATARALAFPPHRVFQLPTGMRALNAMLVGPLPPGRCLCLTDGLLRELDAEALAGVVAHEVGHARMGHPALLLTAVVATPLLLLAPLRLLGLGDADVVVQAALALGAMAALWFVMRRLAHRFEHEADVASVQALGAGPCSHALLVVSRLAQPVTRGWFGRLFTLHPEESDRCQTMRDYERDPGFRARFDARSRRTRRTIGAALFGALVLASGTCTVEWPFERVFWRLHVGDHRGALTAAAAIEHVPERWQRPWQRLQEELAVVRAWRTPADDWQTARAAWSDEAWQRGEEVLLTSGPTAARPWFALVLAHVAEPTDLQRALHGFCAAAAEGDAAHLAAMTAVVRRLGVPTRLAPVFAD